MRIFGSSRNSRTSTLRATNVATTVTSVDESAVRSVEAVGAVEADRQPGADDQSLRALEVTEEMPVFAAVESVESVRPDAATEPADEDGNSDVFVCRRSSPDYGDYVAAADAATQAAAAAAAAVTLFVYGWESVEPGPLSWAFPSLRAALDAVKTMRNAVEWCIVEGGEWVSVDAARAKGAVLIEQNG